MKQSFKQDSTRITKEQESQNKEISIQSKDDKQGGKQNYEAQQKKKAGAGPSKFAQVGNQVGKKQPVVEEKKKQTIKLEDLRFILQKDRLLVSSLGTQFQLYIKNQQIYIQKELKNIEFCRKKVIPSEDIEATKQTFLKYCHAQEYSLKQLRQFISFLETQAIPSINYLLEQIKILEDLINDFELQLKELFAMNEIIEKVSQEENKQNEVLKLEQSQAKLATNAEYSGTKLKNKLQIYVKDRNDEIRELVLHLNKCKVNYHGSSLTFFSTFFFEILMYDQNEEIVDSKQIKEKLQQKLLDPPVKSYKKQCKNILKEYLKEKNVDKYIPDSDEDEFDLKVNYQDEEQKEAPVSEDDQSENNNQNVDQEEEEEENTEGEDKFDPIIEKMDLDLQIERTKQAPKVKSVLRLSKLQL